MVILRKLSTVNFFIAITHFRNGREKQKGSQKNDKTYLWVWDSYFSRILVLTKIGIFNNWYVRIIKLYKC